MADYNGLTILQLLGPKTALLCNFRPVQENSTNMEQLFIPRTFQKIILNVSNVWQFLATPLPSYNTVGVSSQPPIII